MNAITLKELQGPWTQENIYQDHIEPALVQCLSIRGLKNKSSLIQRETQARLVSQFFQDKLKGLKEAAGASLKRQSYQLKPLLQTMDRYAGSYFREVSDARNWEMLLQAAKVAIGVSCVLLFLPQSSVLFAIGTGLMPLALFLILFGHFAKPDDLAWRPVEEDLQALDGLLDAFDASLKELTNS